MVTTGSDQQILRELQALREAVEELQAVQNSRSNVTLRPVSTHLLLGRPVTIVASVTSASGDAPRINAPVTFTTNWGTLRVASGGHQEGTTVTTRTDSQGTARVVLLSPTPEGLTAAQQNALLAMLELLDGDAPTPRETEAGLREMARKYQMPANANFQQAVDVYFREFQSRLVDTINYHDYMQGWSFFDATVTAYASQMGGGDISETAILGIAQTTLQFKDWLGPWLQTLLALTDAESGLEDQLKGVKDLGSDADTLVDGVFGQLRDFFDQQRGLVGEYAGRKVAESSIRRFLDTGVTDLPLETKLDLSPTLEVASRNVVSSGITSIASMDQTRLDLRKSVDTKLSTRVDQATLTSAIDNAFSSRDLVSSRDMTSAIDSAFTSRDLATTRDVTTAIDNAIASRELVSRRDLTTAIDDAISSRGLVNTAGVISAIDDALTSREVLTAQDITARGLVTNQDVTNAINDAITSRDLVNSRDVTTTINNIITSRQLVTRRDMTSAIDDAITTRGLLSTQDITSLGLVSNQDVTNIINDAITSRELVSSRDMTTAIDNAITSRDLVSSRDVTTAIDSAITSRDLVSSRDVTTAINDTITSRQLVTRRDMTTAINNTITSRSLVSSRDVTTAIDSAIASRDLVDMATFEARTTELDNSISKVGNNLLDTRVTLSSNLRTLQ